MVGRLVRSVLSVGLLAGVLVVLPVVRPVTLAGAAPAVVGGSCSSPGPHGFGDVPAGSYYETAVGWLVEAGITSGTAAGVYSPLANVTRGQMAAFLWRSAGSPAFSGGHGFGDVPSGSYFEVAVGWLADQGITSGTSAGVYSPLAKVTRGQMAAFLWRSAGSPACVGGHGFGDVPSGSYFEVAVGWLADQGITSGTSAGVFSPLAKVTRGQMAAFLWRSSCGVETVETAALPEGNARFVDAIVRDMIGRPPTVQELASWSGVLDGTVGREAFVAELADRDEFLQMVVDNVYLSVLDRLPSTAELAAGISLVRADGSTVGLAAGLFGSAEFDVLAGSSTVGFVNTLGQRVFKRDLGETERDPLVTDLDATMVSRVQASTDVYTRATGGRVRAKMWTNKLLSRDPTGGELDLWGTQMLGSGELAVVASIGGSDAYFDLAQERFVEATLTTAPGTVIVTGPQVVSAVYAEDGSGSVVLAAGVIPPAVGDHLVVNNTADPAAGGVGKVTALTQAGNGQTTVSVVAAGLAEAFASGEVVDTTEVTDPNPAPADQSRGLPSGRAAESDCTSELATKVRAEIGIDIRNDSSLSWSLSNFDAKVLVHVTPKMTVTFQGLVASGSCSKDLWDIQWPAPIQAGPVTIPGHFKVSSSVGLSGQITALTLTGSMSLPCRIGVRANKSSVTNLSGCDQMRSTLTVTPHADLSAKVYGDLKFGYFVGVDKGGWAKANIGFNTGLELGMEAEATTGGQKPGWSVDGYLDANIDLEGNMLGKWALNFNLANTRLKEWPLASGAIGQGTPIGGTYQPGEDTTDAAPLPPGSPTAVAAGREHSCALLQDGTVSCWGGNGAGQLGDGTGTDRLTPTAVDGLSGTVSITAGPWHTCAILQDGSAKCWGANTWGQLGDGTDTHQYVPTPVVGLTGVVSISGGDYHSCAAKQDGTAACWGFNHNGGLGDGTTTDRLTPTAVVGLSGVVSITVGNWHSCALLQDGTVSCWGRGINGQLGDGTGTNRLTPTAVVGLSGVVSISAGDYETCAILQDGTVSCWGNSTYGGWGDGTWDDRYVPAMVVGLSGVVSITAGHDHKCALLQDGTVSCWGSSDYGQVGDGTTTYLQETPTAVTGLSGVVSTTTGTWHTCVATQDGTAACWGYNLWGQLGDGTSTNRTTPTPVVGF